MSVILGVIFSQQFLLGLAMAALSLDLFDIPIGKKKSVVHFGMVFIITYCVVYHPYFIIPVVIESMRADGQAVFTESMHTIWGKF